MTKTRVVLVVCACLTVSALLYADGCSSLVTRSSSSPATLDYVGTITLEEPVTNGGTTSIPVAFSGGRWHENSGIVFREFKTSRNEHDIYVTAITCLASGRDEPSRYEIRVRHLVAGTYRVYYLDPDGTRHEIGAVEVEIPEN